MASSSPSAAAPLTLTLEGLAAWGIAAVHPPSVPPPQAPAGGGPPPSQAANGLCWTDNGMRLVSSHNDGSINVFHGESGRREGTVLSREYGARMVAPTHHEHCVLHASTSGRPGDIHSGQVAYHSLYDNRVVRFFRTGSPCTVTSLSVNPLSDWFMATYSDGTFRLWDLRTPNCQATGALEPGEGGCASFDFSGRIFAVASPGRGACVCVCV